jgi:hypothetical protein
MFSGNSQSLKGITHATTQRRDESLQSKSLFMVLSVASSRRRLKAPTFGA